MKTDTHNPLRYTKFLVVFLAAGLLLWGCDQSAPETETAPGGPQSTASQGKSKSPASSQNAALRKLAASLAIAMDNQNLRVALKSEFEQRYTGAPEAIYQRIKDNKIAGRSTLQERLAQSYAQFRSQVKGKPIRSQEARRDVKQYAAEIPKLHIAMLLHLDEWNAQDKAPLVSYMPVDVDDQEQESFEVKAFDADGESHLMRVDSDNVYDARTGKPVDRPVVVLAINERTDSQGNVRPSYMAPPPPGGGGGGGGGDTCTGSYSPVEDGDPVDIYAANVDTDHEYSYLEPAEISFRVFTHEGGQVTDDNYTDPEPQNEWHECEDDDGRNIVKELLEWHFDDFGEYVVINWYEFDEEGGIETATFDYTFPDGVSISVSYNGELKDNDPMGRDYMHKDDDPNETYSARDIDWKTRW